jgi:hypothetical protein
VPTKNEEIVASPKIRIAGFKGPNTRMEFVDSLISTCKPHAWNNIPLPLVEFTQMQLHCWKEFKKIHFGLHNDIITARNETSTQANNCMRDGRSIRMDNAVLLAGSEEKYDGKLALLKQEILEEM